MTLDEANKICNVWGRYLEYAQGPLLLIFGEIPESLLPLPKDALYEAHDIMVEYYDKTGNQDAVRAFKAAAAWLMLYVDDEKALSKAAKRFEEQKWREAIVKSLKRRQIEWKKYWT